MLAGDVSQVATLECLKDSAPVNINEARLEKTGSKLGTTHKGIGPAYSSKTMRNGIRVGDLQDMAYFEKRLSAGAAAAVAERKFTEKRPDSCNTNHTHGP